MEHLEKKEKMHHVVNRIMIAPDNVHTLFHFKCIKPIVTKKRNSYSNNKHMIHLWEHKLSDNNETIFLLDSFKPII